MDEWKKQTLKLKANHGWRAKPGYQICVIGRGAVRFDFPREWIMEPDEVSFKFYDRPHPDDVRLEASYNRIRIPRRRSRSRGHRRLMTRPNDAPTRRAEVMAAESGDRR